MHARFGGGRTEKEPKGHLVGRLPYSWDGLCLASWLSLLRRARPEAEGLEDHAGEAMAELLAVGQRELEPNLVQGYVASRARRFAGRRVLPTFCNS